MAKKIYTAAERKAQFIKTGVALGKKGGIKKVTAAGIAEKCGVSAPMVFKVFGNREALRKAVVRAGKQQGVTIGEWVEPAKKGNAARPAKKAARTANAGAKSAAKPARKRSVKEVKAIKRKVSRSAKTGEFVDKATVKASPDTTVTQTVRVRKPRPLDKYKPAAAPTNVAPNAEPKAAL